METPFKIIISPDGDSIVTVYTEKLELEDLGKPTIFRATEVYFYNHVEGWVVIGIPPLFEKRTFLRDGFKKKSEAVAWEVEYLCKNMERLNARYLEVRDKDGTRDHEEVAA